MKTDKVLVFSVDGKKRSRNWLDVALKSARKYLPDDTKIIVFTDADKYDVGYGAELISVNDVVQRLGLDEIGKYANFHGEPIPAMQFIRLAFPLMEELGEYDKIVYSDIDVEFCDERACGIFDIDVSGYDCAAVAEKTKYALSCDMRMKGAYDDPLADPISVERLKGAKYVNSGVMVVNLKRLRERTTPDVVRRFVEMRKKYSFGCVDQEIINLCWKVKLMGEEYNWLVMLDGSGDCGYIKHYAGDQKIKCSVYPPFDVTYRRPSRVDVVYPVTTPSKNNDIELRWSLRSLDQFGANVGRIIVVSEHHRDWLSDDVIQVVPKSVWPPFQFKHQDMMHKILCAIDECDLHGEFIVSSDDHFLLTDTDLAKMPFYVRNWWVNVSRGSSINLRTMMWNTSMQDTAKFLMEHNLPAIDFQGHWNSHWNADIVRANRMVFDEAMKLRFGAEPSVLMGNLWLRHQEGVPLVIRKDLKVTSMAELPEWAECFSCWDGTFKDAEFRPFMESKFGKASRYEKGDGN